MPRARRTRRRVKVRVKRRASSAATSPRARTLAALRRHAVPAAVRKSAREGLELYDEGFGGKGLTSGAIARAKSLARGTAIDFDRARMMRAWFRRHAVDRRPGWERDKTPGWVAWQLWGGDAAERWVERIVDREG